MFVFRLAGPGTGSTALCTDRRLRTAPCVLRSPSLRPPAGTESRALSRSSVNTRAPGAGASGGTCTQTRRKTLRARSLVEACFWNQSCASRVGGRGGGGGGDAPPCVAFNTRPANHWFGRFQAPFPPAVADTLLLSALAAVIERRTLSPLTLKSARLAQTEARKGRGYATRAHREHVVRAREGELRSPRHGRCVVCIAHLGRTTRGQQAGESPLSSLSQLRGSSARSGRTTCTAVCAKRLSQE